MDLRFTLVNQESGIVISPQRARTATMGNRLTVVLAAIAIVAMIAAPAAGATTFYGPSFQVTPSSITPGETVDIVLTTASSSTYGCVPGGGSIATGCDNAADCDGASATCYFTIQQCNSTDPLQFYLIHQIYVTAPNGESYYLGGATGYSLSWPIAFGGQPGDNTVASKLGPAINVSATDSFTIPFGEDVGGFTLTSSLGNPPNNVNPEGPYYWYAIHASTPIASNVNPTTSAGTYEVDIEGAAACGTTVTQFAIPAVFFDGRITFDTPQFATAVPVAGVAAIALLGLVLLKRKNAIAAPKI